MISLRSHVWAIAERSVAAIHCWELYAGIRIDTKGFKAAAPVIKRPECARCSPPSRSSRLPGEDSLVRGEQILNGILPSQFLFYSSTSKLTHPFSLLGMVE